MNYEVFCITFSFSRLINTQNTYVITTPGAAYCLNSASNVPKIGSSKRIGMLPSFSGSSQSVMSFLAKSP